jgi:hypothetical protein
MSNSAKGAALRIAPELTDRVGSLEIGEHQDMEQFGAGSRSEGLQTVSESAFPAAGGSRVER